MPLNAFAPAIATAMPAPCEPSVMLTAAATEVASMPELSVAVTSSDAAPGWTEAFAGMRAVTWLAMSFLLTAAPSARPTATLWALTTTTATPTARAEIDAVSDAPTLTAPPGAVTAAFEIVAPTEFAIELIATDAPAAAPTPTPCEAFVNPSATPIAWAKIVEPSVALTVTAPPAVLTGAPEMLAVTALAILLTATAPEPARLTPALVPLLSEPPTPTTSAVIVAVSFAVTETPPAPAVTGTPVIDAVTVLPIVFVPTLPLPANTALVSWLVASVSEIARVSALIVLPSAAFTFTALAEKTCIAP